MTTSILSIDCGFDPRATGMLVIIEDREITYEEGQGIGARHETVRGDVEHVAETLAGAGYSVIVARTATGRDVQCTPRATAPHGDYPGYDWDGPVWAVQKKTDNYWCCGPSLDAALSRAGWGADEVRSLADLRDDE